MAELERNAGYGLVIALSITAMIGTGMFFGPAIAASYAGNASLIAWAVLAVITIYIGYCFAELAGMFPDAGGVYEFAKQAYGRFSSFIVGWIAWLVGSITPAVLIVATIKYLGNLVPGLTPTYSIVLAVSLVILMNYVAYRGIEASTAVLLFFAVVVVLVLVIIVAFGAPHVAVENYTPVFDGGATPLVIFVALFFIMETFFGWESATFMGSETRNPSVIIPRSIIITTYIVAVLGVSFAVVILGVIPWQTLVTYETPISDVALHLFGPTGAFVANIAIILALIGSAAGGIVSAPRLLMAMAKDRLFIEQLAAIHPRRKTPYKAIIFQAVASVIVIIAAFGDYASLLSMLIPLALFMYISVIIAVPVTRRKYPGAKRTVKAPFGRVLPYAAVLFYLSVIVAWLFLEPQAFSLFKKILSFLLFGVPIYLLLNLYYNPDLLLRMMNSFAFLNRFVERFTLPKGIRQDVLDIFSTLKGKTVLEFGSGVGSFTMPLADAVGDTGRIYAVDLSPKNVEILNKRLEKRGHKHVSVVHDEHFISRVHPDIPSVDMVFSVGNLSYVQDVERVLKDMHNLLPENGQICLVEYIDYFWGIIPNHAWLDDLKELEKLFRKIGFSIRIKKRRGLFWRYLYIYGIKSEYDVPVI
ncbi:amino acid permease [Candidatus Woesearchaeota archaeon]|nr:amino acid permease [Candidatus Woesearchaeota archaeon]